jgi:hypothetical protein
MKLFRTLKWKILDRFPELDRKENYRRPARTLEAYKTEPKLNPIDSVIAGFLSLILLGAGLFGLAVGLFVFWAIITNI